MAKKAKTRNIAVTPKDLARALEGISASVQALRRLILKLPAATTITLTVSTDDPSAFYWDNNCPPPE